MSDTDETHSAASSLPSMRGQFVAPRPAYFEQLGTNQTPMADNKHRSVSSPPRPASSSTSSYTSTAAASSSTYASSAKISRLLGPESLTEHDHENEGENDEDDDTDLSSTRERVVMSAEPTRDELQVSARISGAETVKNSSGEYVHYFISVGTGGSGGLQWKVARRFREFEALHSTLASKFGSDKLPSLPKKALRRNLDPEYVRKKKTELSRYLSDLVLDPQVVTSEPLAHFLIANIQDLIRSNISNIRQCADGRREVKELESELLRSTSRRKSLEKSLHDHTKITDELREQLRRSEEERTITNNELTMLHTAWEEKFEHTVAYAKELKAEKKAALKAVRDLDEHIRRLKLEKKTLVKAVKELQFNGNLAGGPVDGANIDDAITTPMNPTDSPSVSRLPSGSGTSTPNYEFNESPLLISGYPSTARFQSMRPILGSIELDQADDPNQSHPTPMTLDENAQPPPSISTSASLPTIERLRLSGE